MIVTLKYTCGTSGNQSAPADPWDLPGRKQAKDMAADERLSAREAAAAPKVDALFEYVHSLEGSDEVFSDRMKKAITYAVNQEQNLRRFLTDGKIPCDNGYSFG